MGKGGIRLFRVFRKLIHFSQKCSSVFLAVHSQLNRWPCHSLTHSLTHWLTDSLSHFWFLSTKRDPLDIPDLPTWPTYLTYLHDLPTDLVTTGYNWLQFWQLRTWIHDNFCYMTITSDSGQHSQFLRCFLQKLAYLARQFGGAGWCSTFWASYFTCFGTQNGQKQVLRIGQPPHFGKNSQKMLSQDALGVMLFTDWLTDG